MLDIYYLITFCFIFQISEARCRQTSNGIFRFGPKCGFMCHCQNSEQCNDSTGECTSGCASFWYGPGCQYRDIAEGEFSRHSDNLPAGQLKYSNLANDGDKNTCSSTADVGSSEKKVNPFWKVWFPINETIRELEIVTLNEYLHYFSSFTVYVEYVQPAEKETFYYASMFRQECYKHGDDALKNRSFTVLCNRPVSGNQVRIELAELQTQLVLCDVRINGGRNLAFERKTSQISTHEHCTRNTECSSGKAVDGNEGDRYWKQCSLTSDENGPWWRIDLDRKTTILYIRILLSQVDTSAYQLEVSNATNEVGKSVYDVYAKTSSQINLTFNSIGERVKLTKGTTRGRLGICEAYFFGDCLEDVCGYKCEEDCHCRQPTVWDKMAGTCSKGCKDGWMGSQCDIQQSCSEHCKDGHIACNKADDTCLNGCNDGLKGDKCDQVCTNGYYGENCGNSCSRQCLGGICQNVDGRCTNGCVDGWRGIKCKQRCKSGMYGKNCSRHCSEYCKNGNKRCRPENGHCYHGCKAGWKGDNCDKVCSSRYYGENCRNKCSDKCVGGYCQRDDGRCANGCVDGWIGITCDQPCKSGMFGKNCSRQCSQYCKNGNKWCSHRNGNCFHGCMPGWKGVHCDQACKIGMYGENCSRHCSEYCKYGNKRCRPENGHCYHGCKAGWKGANCKQECQDGTFGDKCHLNCSGNCKNDELCEKVHGSCRNGCKPGYVDKQCARECENGWFGRECSNKCSSNCKNGNTCDGKNGQCPRGCKPGYTGTMCKQNCTVGFYGDECRHNCSGHCEGGTELCSNIDGHCMSRCKTGWKGTKCDSECSDGFYGFDCAETCSNCKTGTVCHKVDGTCNEGCDAGYTGKHCSKECDDGFYGINCSTKCGNCMSGTICHKVLGTCSAGCETGYSGYSCLQGMQKSDNVVAMTTGGAAIVIFILIVLAIIVIVYRKRKEQRRRSNNSDPKSETNIQLSNVVSQRNCKKERKQRTENVHLSAGATGDTEANNVSTSEVNVYNNVPMVSQTKHAIPLSSLVSYVKGNMASSDYFTKEFQELPFGMKYPSTVGANRYNKMKNRYKDMHAYNHTRVVLKTLAKEQWSDYINASFIKGYAKEKAYIAAQGPIETTVDDFWRMIWEKDIYTIVMVTNLVEETKRKCLQYWPPVESSTRYGDFIVRTESEAVFAEFTIRNLKVVFEKGNPSRTITQFHFTAWPDKSVPRSTSSLLQFWRKVRTNDANKARTWLVHCSAGVGRTGTFIATDILYDQGKDKAYVDVYQCIRDLRDQRVNMVQTKNQYLFLHGLMIEEFVLPSEPVPLEHFHQVINDLKDLDNAARKTKLLLQYEALKEDLAFLFTNDKTEEKYSAAMLEENRTKNRNNSIIPPNEFRPFLITAITGCTNYINAVYIPSYCDIHGFILTQKPLGNTAIDCCRLVYEQEVKVIVTFPAKVKEQDGTYMPEDGTVKLGPFTVTKMSEEDKHFYKKKTFVMTYDTEEHELTQLMFKYWPVDRITPSDPLNMLNFMQEVEIYRRKTDNNPVLVQCLDGSEKSGLFVVLMNILERARLDNEVSIPQVIRQLRIRRQQLIPNFEQFKFCFDVLLCHVESNAMYANM